MQHANRNILISHLYAPGPWRETPSCSVCYLLFLILICDSPVGICIPCVCTNALLADKRSVMAQHVEGFINHEDPRKHPSVGGVRFVLPSWSNRLVDIFLPIARAIPNIVVQ